MTNRRIMIFSTAFLSIMVVVGIGFWSVFNQNPAVTTEQPEGARALAKLLNDGD